ncbi:hypothetical protein SAMN06295885_2169 [Rathayibacter oskolensis]|uniref:SCP-2 sterol transfer family protein n=1 Tax=Rathayibacter oskolensis TaxID=1891671 RepID=A0A1X7NZA2_9MICO|nr:hypothetical protein [Rathayibacter oskolensis]SMH43194.1 hypothetical protein SAMN06295885_2169 [Rathayibacter oskolensis]
MLTELDDRVLAAVNLHAVLGALPRLVELSPEAARALAPVTKPTTLTLVAPGGLRASYTFTRTAIRRGGGAPGPTLLFTSAKHLNAVIAGTAQPVPVAGPRGIAFLTKVFTPISALLGEALTSEDPALTDRTTLLTLEVVASALTVIANGDRSGRVSAAHMADGDLDIEVGDDLRYRIRVREHRLSRLSDPVGGPRAALRFDDLGVAGDVLSGRETALACVADGRVTMRGYIPLIDNTNRLLDRVGAYLGAS